MMIRFVGGGCALAFGMLAPALASDKESDARALPMQFELRREGPAQNCGKQCRVWVSATGTIFAETPRHFEAFGRGRDLRGVTLALDSDGGSVTGALALGRAIRRLGMSTTVGKTVEVSSEPKDRRSALLPRAYCGSMCTFVLLAGVERDVPPQARVLVHQIWLGDRRDDPTAASYSAEDLVLVQRDIGRLAQYTMEMAGSVDLLEVTLKIPPWEPMYELTRNELRNMRLVTNDAAPNRHLTTAAKSPASLANGSRAASAGRGWAMIENSGAAALARRHPLTIHGDDIGSFDLNLSCANTADQYIITYTETRTSPDHRRLTESLRAVELTLGGKSVPLKLLSSKPNGSPAARDSLASGNVPAALIKSFAEPGNQSLTVETSSLDDSATVINIGNAGLARTFPQLVASCNQMQARGTPSNLGAGDVEQASVRGPAQ